MISASFCEVRLVRIEPRGAAPVPAVASAKRTDVTGPSDAIQAPERRRTLPDKSAMVRHECDVDVTRREAGGDVRRNPALDGERGVVDERVPKGARVQIADDRRPERRQSTRSHFEPIFPSFG
jgi:hypothetical protein